MNDTNAGSTTESGAGDQPVAPVLDTENGNSAASSTGEETNTNQAQSSEGQDKKSDVTKEGGDAGFADHPRWKERETDWTKRFNDQETRHVNEIANLRTEFDTKYGAKPAPVVQAPADATPEQPPEWFGGDEKAWKSFREWNNKELSAAEERGAQRAIKELSSKSDAEQKAIKEATEYFGTEVSAIEADATLNPNGLKVDRNKLLKTALDNDLIDSKGRWNYKAAFKLMKPGEVFQAKAALDEKKKIASASTSDQRTESKPEKVTTSEDFKKDRPW